MPWISDQERQGRGDRMNKWIRLESKLWIRYVYHRELTTKYDKISYWGQKGNSRPGTNKDSNIWTTRYLIIFSQRQRFKYFNYSISHNILTETKI